MATAKQLDAHERRMLRLRHELEDEGIWLPGDEALLALLLAELDYARHPHAHEGVAPRYGAMLAHAGRDAPPAGSGARGRRHRGRPAERRPPSRRRPLLVRRPHRRRRRAAGLLRPHEGVRVVSRPPRRRTDALVVQRLGRGWIRLSTPNGVSTFDGIRWSAKRLAGDLAAHIAPHVPGADPTCSPTSSSCARTGSAPVGSGRPSCGASRRPPRAPRRRHERRRRDPARSTSRTAPTSRRSSTRCRSTTAPPSSTRRESSPRWACSSGRPSTAAPSTRIGGTRHTSALRFSADEPGALVFVVSSNGPLSVFRHGARLALD